MKHPSEPMPNNRHSASEDLSPSAIRAHQPPLDHTNTDVASSQALLPTDRADVPILHSDQHASAPNTTGGEFTPEAALQHACRSAAASGCLLLACDVDGTIAPLAARPQLASVDPGVLRVLHHLRSLPGTHVAIVSGRGLSDVLTLVGDYEGWDYIASHGAEHRGHIIIAPNPAVPPEVLDQYEALIAALPGPKLEGVHVEIKPVGVAVHYRNAPDPAAVASAMREFAQGFPLLQFREGHMVSEWQYCTADKGSALAALRSRLGATQVMFVGDDRTDEDAFAVLASTDVSVKVGADETRARYRVRDVNGVRALFETLLAERLAAQAAKGTVPIASYSVLSDQRTVALVSPSADIHWLCLPRIDSPPLFAAMLGDQRAGYFSVRPHESDTPPVQTYVGATLVLKTEWKNVRVTDYMDCGGGRAFQRAGRTDLVRVIEGSGQCTIEFAPRLDFGRVPTRLSLRENGLAVDGTSDSVVLYSPGVTWTLRDEGTHHTAAATVDLNNGPVVLELRAGTLSDRPNSLAEPVRRGATAAFWSNWAGSLRPPAVARAQVVRSALMLRSLVHGPSGALAAAATTSLPEHAGGVRNWDYRYCWPRDAAMAAAALVKIGNTGTAMRLLDWLARVLDTCEEPGKLRPIYAVDGRDLGPEGEISGLAGYLDSLPIRVGNAASMQVQLDVFGPIADLIALLADAGAPISPDHWRLTRAMVEAVGERWAEPDHGIWEERAVKRHHLHSKVMCYFTVARALVVHEHVMGKSNQQWLDLQERIREDVLTKGYDADLGCFTAAYDRKDADAATLTIGLRGLVSATDERFVRTLERIEKTLYYNGTVVRYRYQDGLPGTEGGFHLCTGWLIESMVRCGRIKRAAELFDRFLRWVGPTGVLSEQGDPHTGLALGNTPQAYSHLALINCALALDPYVSHDQHNIIQHSNDRGAP